MHEYFGGSVKDLCTLSLSSEIWPSDALCCNLQNHLANILPSRICMGGSERAWNLLCDAGK